MLRRRMRARALSSGRVGWLGTRLPGRHREVRRNAEILDYELFECDRLLQARPRLRLRLLERP